jgi:hypothetical protein
MISDLSTLVRYPDTMHPDYLWNWSGKSDHNKITMSLYNVYTWQKIWAQSECGKDQGKGHMGRQGSLVVRV